MTKNSSLWRKFLICILSVLMLATLTFGLVSITARAEVKSGTEFTKYLQYTRAKDEKGNVITDGRAGWIITGFQYIASDSDNGDVVFGSTGNPAQIPAFYHEPGEDESESLPVIGIAQGAFAGYPLGVVTFEQIERNAGDAENDRKFGLLHNFVLSDTVTVDGKEYAPSFLVTGADYGTAMLSIGGYYADGRKIAANDFNSDNAETLQSLGAGVFEGCQKLTTVTLPGTVKEMGPGVFKQSGIQTIKSTTPLGGLTYSGDVYTTGTTNEFTSMQGLVYLNKLPYRAFYRSTSFDNLVLPDYAGSAQSDRTKVVRAKYNSADNLLHAHEENGTAYFVPMYDMNGDGKYDRTETSKDMLTVHTVAGLSELGDEAFYYSDGLKNATVTSVVPVSDKAKIKNTRLYLAGVIKMGISTFNHVGGGSALYMDMGRAISPGTVEGYPGAYNTQKIAWYEGAPYYATFTVSSSDRYNFAASWFNKEATYVFNAQTQEICGVWQNRKDGTFNQTAGQTILIPYQIKTFKQFNDENGKTILGDTPSDSPINKNGVYVKGIAEGAFCGVTEAYNLIFDEWSSSEARHGGRIFTSPEDYAGGSTITQIKPNTFRSSTIRAIYNMPEGITEFAQESFEQGKIEVITTDSTTAVDSDGNIYVHNYYFTENFDGPVDYAPIGNYQVVTNVAGEAGAAVSRSTLWSGYNNILVTDLGLAQTSVKVTVATSASTALSTSKMVVFPLALKKIGYRTFRGNSSSYHKFTKVIIPGSAEDMDIDAAAFTEADAIQEIYFGGWTEQTRKQMLAYVNHNTTDNIDGWNYTWAEWTQGSVKERAQSDWTNTTKGRWQWTPTYSENHINPNTLPNWPWSANSAKMYYSPVRSSNATSITGWTNLGAAQVTDSTGIWTVFYDYGSGKREGNIVGVNMANLLEAATNSSNPNHAQAKEWLFNVGSSGSVSYYIQGDNTPPGTLVTSTMRHVSLLIPSQLTATWNGKQETITIRTLGAPSGDVKMLGGSVSNGAANGDMGAYIFDELRIPKEVRNITTATFQNIQIRSLVFETDKLNRNEGMQTLGTSAFRDCNIEHLQLPEYSLRVLGDRAFEANNLNPHHDLAKDGHVDNDFLVIPGNVVTVSPTAFKNASDGIQRIYVMQYSETPSDGYYDLMDGKYNNNNLRAAGSMGINYNGTPITAYFVDQFRPEFYEVGKVGDEWQALVALAGSVDNNGAYDLPYVYRGEDSPLFVHPILNGNNEFTGEVAIRFGVRMLLQGDMGTIFEVTEANGTGAKLITTPQKYNDPEDKENYGTDFYIVELNGITENSTYTFRVQYYNDVLTNALIASGFDYYSGRLFVTEFNIPVNVFSTVTYTHAVAATPDDNNRLPDPQTANFINEDGNEQRIAFYTGYAYDYKSEDRADNEVVYRRDTSVGSKTQKVTSDIYLGYMKEGADYKEFSNHAYAEFIGWTTDTTLASSLQLDIPAEYTAENGSMFFAPGTDHDPYPLDVLLGENNSTNTARLYSVFRYVVRSEAEEGEIDEALGWIYGEDPLSSDYNGRNEKESRLPALLDNVAGGYLTLVKIEDIVSYSIEDNVSYSIVKNIQVGVGNFTNALGTAMNPGLSVGTYRLYGGLLEEKDLANLENRAAITARFKVTPLDIVVYELKTQQPYGAHVLDAGGEFSVANYLYENIKIEAIQSLIDTKRVTQVPDETEEILKLIAPDVWAQIKGTYPGVGEYDFTYDLADGDAQFNYNLPTKANSNEIDYVDISYEVVARGIDISGAGLETEGTLISQSSPNTFTWMYNGTNTESAQYATFARGNYFDTIAQRNGSAASNVPVLGTDYEYVWIKNADSDPTGSADSVTVQNAETYKLYIKWLDENYTIKSVNGTDNSDDADYVFVCYATITKANFDVNEAENSDLYYNGTQQGEGITVDVVDGDQAAIDKKTLTQSDIYKVTYSTSNNGTYGDLEDVLGTNAATYIIWYKVTSNDAKAGDNYNDATGYFVYEILPARVIVTTNNPDSVTYNGFGHEINPADENQNGNVLVAYAIYTENNKAYGALDNANSTRPLVENVAYYIGGALLDAEKYTHPTNAGTYLVRVTLSSNYVIVNDKNVEQGNSVELTFIINAYELTENDITFNDGANATYDATAKTDSAEITASVTYTKDAATITESTEGTDNRLQVMYSADGYTYTTDKPTYTAAGTYTIWYRVLDVEGFSNYVAYNGRYTFTIEQAEFTKVTATGNITGTYKDGTYGDEFDVTIVLGVEKDPDFEWTVEYSTDGGRSWSTAKPTYRNAGVYSVMFRIVSDNYKTYVAENYTFNENLVKNEYTITINRKSLTFTPQEVEYYYNGGLQGNFTLTANGLVGNDGNTSYVLEFWMKVEGKATEHTTSMPTFKDADTYTVYYTVADGGNYTSQDECYYIVTIKPAEFTVALTSDAANGLSYRGTEFNRAEIIAISAVEEHGGVIPVFGTDYKVSYTLGGNTSANVLNAGSYTVTIEVISGNFLISYTTGGQTQTTEDPYTLKFTIKQAVVGVEAYTPLFTYSGAAQYSGARFTGTINGLPPTVASDSLLFSANVDTVYVFDDGTVGVNDSIEGKTLIYTLSLIKGVGYTNVGTYTINVTFTDDGNFKLAEDKTGYSYEITAAQVRLNGFNSPVFNNKAQEANISFNLSIFSADDYTVEYEIDGKYGATAPTNAGTYNVKVSLKSTNFAFESGEEYIIQQFTIQQLNIATPVNATVEITLDNTHIYTGSGVQAKIVSYTITFTNGGEAITYSAEQDAYSAFIVNYYSNNVAAGANATAYIIPNTATNTGSTNNSANFTGIKSVTFTINQKSLGTGDYNSTADLATLNDGEIAETNISSSSEMLVYSGNAFTLMPTVIYTPEGADRNTLSSGSDYTVTYYYRDSAGAWSTKSVLNAGAYRAVIEAVSGGNYTGRYIVEFEVQQVEVSVFADTASVVYDTQSHQIGAAFANAINGALPANGEYAIQYTGYTSDYFGSKHDNYKNVGTYTVTVTFEEDGNFKFADGVYTATYTYLITPAIIAISPIPHGTFNNDAVNGLRVNPADVTFTAVNSTTIDSATIARLITYSFKYSVADIANNNAKLIQNTDGDWVPFNAGTYYIDVVLSMGGNFAFTAPSSGNDYTEENYSIQLTYIVDAFDISANSAKFQAIIPDATYSGSTVQLANVVASVMIGGRETELKAGTDNVSSYDYTVLTTQVLVGQGTAIFTGVGNYTGTAEAKFNVIPMRIKVELQLQSTVYGEAIVITTEENVGWKYAAGSKNIVSGDSLGLQITINDSGILFKGAPVGFYALNISYANPNYLVTFVFNDEANDVEYEQTILYADAKDTDYYIGALKDEDWFGDASKEPTENSGTVETLYSITLRIINVVISRQSVQYGDEFTGIGEIRLDSSTVGSNSPYYINSSNGTGTPIVGTDTVTIRFTTSANVGDGVGYYPIYVAGGGSNGPANNVQKYQITFSGDWNPNLNSDSRKALPNGYDSRYTYGSDGSITNYGAGVLEIVEREITVTADGATVVYGEAMPEIEELTKERTSGEGNAIYGSDELEFAINVGAKQGDPVGDYPISVKVIESDYAKNYKFTYVNGVLTIVKRAVTITIEDNSSTYGAKVTSLGTVYGTNWTAEAPETLTGDAIYGEDATKLGIKFTLGSYNDTSLAGGTLNAGEYVITGSVEGATADNYDITWVNGKFTVSKAELTFEPITKYFTYNGTEQGVFNINAYDGLQNNESDSAYRLEYWENDGTHVNSMPTFKDAGTYKVSFTIAEGSNYISDEYFYTVIITPAKVTAEATDSTLVYNGEKQYSGVSFRPTIQNLPPMIETGMDFGGGKVLYVYDGTVSTSPVTGKTLIYKLTLKEDDYENVGTYYIDVEFADGGNFAFDVDGDYNVTYKGSYSFVIIPATITVAATQSSVIYDGSEHKVAPKFTNVLNANAIPTAGYSLDYSYESYYFNNIHNGYINVGNYTVDVTLEEGGNFVFGGNSDDTYVYTAQYTYSITPFTLSANILGSKEYNGKDQRPTSITFTPASPAVGEGEYQLVYSPGSFIDVGQYTVTVWLFKEGTDIPSGTEAARSYLYGGNFAFNGSGDSYYYSRSLNFTIYAFDLNDHGATPTWNTDGKLTGEGYEYVFKFAAWEPITGGVVEFGNSTEFQLIVGTHFTATYSNNINVGTASVTLSGIGNFTGTADFTFEIVPASLGDITVSETSGAYVFSDEQDNNTTANSERFTTVATLNKQYPYNGVVLTLPLSLAYRYDITSEAANQTLVVDVHFAVTYYRQNANGTWTALNSGDEVKDVGVYRAYLTATGENYDGYYLIEFEITAAEVTVALAEIEQDENGNFTVVYDGYAHQYGVVFSADGGVIPVSDGYSVDYSYSSEYFGTDSNGYRNSGTYTVKVEIKSGNFVWANNAGADENGYVYLTYEITPAEVTSATLSPATGVYTGMGHDLSNNVIYTGETRTPNNSINTKANVPVDTVSYTYVAAAGSSNASVVNGLPVNVGVYKVTATLGYDAENHAEGGGNLYFAKNSDGTYVYTYELEYQITPAIISAAAASGEMDYNGEKQHSNVRFTGLGVLPEDSDVFDLNSATWNESTKSYSVEGGIYTLTFDEYSSDNGYFADHNKYSNVGTYTVTVTLNDGGNFKFADGYTATYSYKITPALVSLNNLTEAFEYNAKNQAPTESDVSFTPGSSVKNPSYDYRVTPPDGDYAAVGQYTAIVQLGMEISGAFVEGGNFAFRKSGQDYDYTSNLTYSIRAFRLTEDNTDLYDVVVSLDNLPDAWVDAVYTYTSSAITPIESAVVNFSDNSKMLLDSSDYSLFYASNINAGTASVTISGYGNYTGSFTLTFTIAPKSLEDEDITHTDIVNVVYTGEEFSYAALTVSYNGRSLVEGTHYNVYFFASKVENPVQNGAVKGNISAPVNAGTYYLLVAAVEGGNYADYLWIEFTIDKAIVKVVASGVTNIEYDGTAHELDYYFIIANSTATLEDNDYTEAYSYDGTKYGFEQGAGHDGYRNAGVYTLTISLTDKGSINFMFAEDDGVVTGNVFTYEITPRTVSAELVDTTVYYDTTSKEAGVIFTHSGIQPTSAQYTLSYSSDRFGTEHVNAGEYLVVMSLNSLNFRFNAGTASQPDYRQKIAITTAGGKNFVISPTALNVSLITSSSTYDGNAVVLKDEILLTNVSGTGNNVLPNMDNISVYHGTDEENTTATNAGVYYISLIINDGYANYDSTNFVFRLTGANTYYSEVDQGSQGQDVVAIYYVITPARITLDAFDSPVYNGKEQAVALNFYDEYGNRVKLKADIDYTLEHSDSNGDTGIPLNAGKYSVTVTLTNDSVFGNYMFGTIRGEDTLLYNYVLTRDYVIQALQLTLEHIISVSGDDYGVFNDDLEFENGKYSTTYDGTEKTPVPTLEVMLDAGNHTLTEEIDYTLSYVGNINATYSYRRGPIPDNAAYVIITGSGNYGGEVRMPFRIYQANLSFTLESRGGQFTNQIHEIVVAKFINVDGGPAPEATEVGYSMAYYTLDSDGNKVYTTAPIASATYYVEITLSDWSGNYYILNTSDEGGRPSVSQEEYGEYASYVIGQIEITVTVTDNEVTYIARRQTATITISDANGQNNRMPVLGTDYTVTYEVNDRISDNDNAQLLNGEPYNAGKYVITIKLNDTTNYVLKSVVINGIKQDATGDTITADFTIDKALVEAYVVGASAEYDGNIYNLTSRNMLYVTAIGVNIFNSDLSHETDTYTVTYKSNNGVALGENGRPINAGSYDVTITLSSNFKWNEGDNGFVNGSVVVKVDSASDDTVAYFTFTITPATVNVEVLGGATVTYNGKEFNASDYINVYNATNPRLVPELDSLAEDAADTYTISTSGTLLNAGSYILTVTINGGNYVIYVANGENVSEREYNFTITPSIITVNYEDADRIYNGEKWDIGELKFTNTLAESNPDYANVLPTMDAALDINRYSISINGDFTTVGAHTVTIAFKEYGNFSFETAGYQFVYEKVVTYTIDPATIAVNTEDGSWFAGRQGNHGDVLQPSYSVTAHYQPYGADYEGAYKLIIGAESFKLVDGATANVSVTDIYTADGEYAVDASNNYVMLKVGVYRLTLLVSAPNHERAEFEIVVTIVRNTVRITLKDGASITHTYGQVSTLDSNSVIEEFYKLIADITGVPANDDGSEKTLEEKIEWLKAIGFSITVNADPNDYSGAGYLNAKAYSVSIDLADTANNEVRFSNNYDYVAGLYVIEKLEVVVEWGEYFNGTDYMYDGTDVNDGRTLAAFDLMDGIKVGNALPGDMVSFQYKRAGTYGQLGFEEVAKNVGEYSVIVRLLTGADAANYSFESAENTFNIVRRRVDVNLSNSNSLYGEDYSGTFSYTAPDSVLSAETKEDALRAFILPLLELRLNGETYYGYPQVGTTYTVTTVAGLATVNVNGVEIVVVDYLDNFTLYFMSDGTHTATSRTVTITASASSVYGDGLANVEDIVWSAANLADGETKEMLGIIFVINERASADAVNGVYLKQVGTYSFGVFSGSSTNANYNVVFEGTYTVTPRPITIVPELGTSMYGEELPDLDGWSWSVKDGSIVYGDEGTILVSFYYEGRRDGVMPNVGDRIHIIGRVEDGSNGNYEVTFDWDVLMEIVAREVTIVIGNDTAVYGNLHVGDILSLTYADTVEGLATWTYADGSKEIFENDLMNLTFYLGSQTSERLYATVGTYNIIGLWGSVTGNATAIRNYNIYFEYGSFVITEAAITSGAGASWERNFVYRQGADGEYTDATGWYAMTIDPATYIVLVGDYAIDDTTEFRFVEVNDNYIEYVAYGDRYDNDDVITIRYYLPTITDNAVGQWRYDEDSHSWLVHSVGTWKMTIVVMQANHITEEFTLTYVITPINVNVSLDPVYNQTGRPLELVYNAYENIEELNDILFNYVLGAERMRDSLVLGIYGFDPVGGTSEDHYQWIKQYCKIEVVATQDDMSSAGRLNIGMYDIKIVAGEDCWFTVMFTPGYTDGSGRLIISRAQLSITWAEEEFEEDGTQIVTVGEDLITYLYTGAPYSQAPKFEGILSNNGIFDEIDAPHFEYRLPDGTVIDNPRDVLNGNYVIRVTGMSGKDSDNYLLPETLEMALRIVPRDITVSISDVVSVYGEYSDEYIAQMLTDIGRYAEASWLGAGDTIELLNIVLAKEAGLNAGDYAISGTYSNANYNVEFVNGTYTVTPKQVTVTIGDIEKTFGDAMADLNANYTAEGVLEGETLDMTFEIVGATYFNGYLEVSDDAAGYAIVGYDNDANYEIIFVGNWSDGKSGIYKVNKAINAWIQEFLFDSIVEGDEPLATDLPISKYGPAVIEYYYDEAMTNRVEVPVSQLVEGTYYAKAYVVESKNYTGLTVEKHVFNVLTSVIPYNRNVDILGIVILLTVETITLACGLIFIRRRKDKNNNEEGR